MAGVIDKADSQRFKRILFRVTRGMTWTALIDIESARNQQEANDLSHLVENASGKKIEKSVFLIVYQGGSYDMMKTKLIKICDSFGASK